MRKFHNKSNIYVTQIELKVEDLKRSLDFYKNIMGFKVLEEKEKELILTIDGSTPIINLRQPKDVIKKIPKRTGLYHFAILLPNRLQLGSFLKNIKEKNYPILGGANHEVSEAIYLQDPDDNGIEIYSDIDSSKWIWEDKKVQMSNRLLDYEDLLSQSENSRWIGMPEDAIIGHIHLHVDNLEKAKDFYVNGLGFDVVMEMGKSALFLSSGGYHHHVGLNIWNGTDVGPLPQNSVGMEYYTIKLPNKDMRKETINRLKKLNYKIIEKGKKVYTKDTSGNSIKLEV
ncbi:VOC family protein [Senegalia massiliensis]|uniref:VOC family protein n=1 Tax=Senegalia massiliensis TaxID=1720316 RepID=UPI001030405B|nr:VOC family protein [Senegalia massiliensis]